MVIIDEDEANERSPLKSPTAPLPSVTPAPAAPPPYAATASSYIPPPPTHVQSYHIVIDGPDVDPVLLIRRDTPAKRFLKAFACALFILFLWSVFIDTISLVSRDARPPKHRRIYAKMHSNNVGRWVVRDWYGATTPAEVPCPCDAVAFPSMPSRALPIQYPPAFPQVERASTLA